MKTSKLSGVGFSALMLALVSIVLCTQPAYAQVKAEHKEHGAHLQACAKACSVCLVECSSCATHCGQLISEGKKDHVTTFMTCQDCADVCASAALIVGRSGPFASLICASCADACAKCGKECEKFSADEHMKQCAEECHKCEKACRDMLKHLATK